LTCHLFATFLLAASPVAGSYAAEPSVVGGAEAADVMTTVATVEAIDVDQRQITMKTTDGKTVVFNAGPEVRNFDRVRKGDRVVVDYYEGLAVALGPKDLGIRERVDSVDVARANKGAKPAMAVTGTVDVEATVEAVDRKNRLVTVRGAVHTVVLKVAEDVDLSNVKVGDAVYARYTETYAVGVLPPADASGEVRLESTSIAVGIGVSWGHGTVTLTDGTKKKFKVSGLSLADLGVASVQADGYVYGLKDPADLAGVYYGVRTGMAVGAGGGDSVLKSSKGVVLRLSTRQEGVRLAIGAGGIKIDHVD
jgi:Cu/Ag efflux protein CusF